MRRWVGTLALLTSVAVAGACGAASEKPSQPASNLSPASGGTLRGGLLLGNPAPEALGLPEGFDRNLDPQMDAVPSVLFELYRCCLVRTLLATNGRPAAEGGADVRPDLAAEMPEVSDDGLVWTFRLKPGLHYAPPLEGTEITSPDFVRAIERALSPSAEAFRECCNWGPFINSTSFYFLGVIAGTPEFVTGQADTISGLETPDSHTLVVHLIRPTGDLGFRLSLPVAAPIPPHPTDPDARLGVAEGHESGYGPFLVASGPYMVEGSERLDFSLLAGEQRPAAGYVPGESITLVRNPSWDPATDDLRPAYADRIELLNQESTESAAAKVDSGALDLIVDANAPLEQIQRYEGTPELRARVHHTFNDFTGAVTMNLALPPFDDPHVRRALNWIVDKQALSRFFGVKPLAAFGYVYGEIAGHIAPDSLEGNLLQDYDPYATPGHRGDVQKARAEMALSKYDHDGDGICDDPACRNILFGVWKDCAHEEMAEIVRGSARGIGLDLDIELYPDAATTYTTVLDPRNKVAATLGIGWGKDFSNGSAFFFSPFYGPGLNGVRTAVNHSLVGATSDDLAEWGYSVTSVPSVDDKLERCVTLRGRDQLQCWAQLDEFLTEDVVPWVPFIFGSDVVTVSARVAQYDYAQGFGTPALDRIALVPGSD